MIYVCIYRHTEEVTHQTQHFDLRCQLIATCLVLLLLTLIIIVYFICVRILNAVEFDFKIIVGGELLIDEYLLAAVYKKTFCVGNIA